MRDIITNPIILGVCGMSGSGKSTITDIIRSQLTKSGYSVSCLSEDFYYHDQQHKSFEERVATNYDVPEAFEHTLLEAHLEMLRNGQSVDAPVYSFEQHTRDLSKTQLIQPAHVIIVEGILILHDEKIYSKLDRSLYVNTDIETCRIRRQQRDIRERGRTEASCKAVWDEKVGPLGLQLVIPSSFKAEMCVNNVHDRTKVERCIQEYISGFLKNKLEQSILSDHQGKKKLKIPPETRAAKKARIEKISYANTQTLFRAPPLTAIERDRTTSPTAQIPC